jgi:hypothetical protein
MLGFSSTEITKAFSGGLRYKPTTSAAFTANSLSVLTHHERCRCKQIPSCRSTRHTACTEPFRWAATAGPVPTRLTGRWRLLQQRQHAVAKVLAIDGFGAWPRRVAQAGQSALHKALPPFDDGIRPGAAGARHLLHSLPSQTPQDDLRSLR